MRQVGCWALAALVVVAAGLADCHAQSLIPPATAMRYGLKRAWFAQVGAAATMGRLSHVKYDDGMLLVQSRMGVVTALDAETGRTLWTTRIGNREGSEPAANDKHIVVLNGSTLFVLERSSGEVLWERRVGSAPGAGPGVSDTHAFVPMISGLIEGYDLEEGRHQTPWNYQSSGHVLLPPMITPLTVSWTTDRGFFYVADPAGGGIRYRLETRGAIHSRPAAWSPRLFATSADGYVYALNEKKGKLDWKYVVGEPMYERPVAVDDKLFAFSNSGNLYCLDAAQGSLLWQARGIHQFVSKSPTRVYVEDTQGKLAILDAESGARLGALPTSSRTRKLVNGKTDRIYLIDETCAIQCLHEPQLTSPVKYVAPAEEAADLKLAPEKQEGAPAAKPADEAPAPADDMPDDAPADDNPFAPPAGDDNPFAPPAGGDDPFGPAGGDDNPFAPPAGGDDPFAPGA